MSPLLSLLPSGEKGYLSYYLFFIGFVAIGNSVQNYATLHYTRRIYNGLFVPTAAHADSVSKLVPDESGNKRAEDQVTPLAARLFGTYTFLGGLIRIYASYELENRFLYQLAFWTHVLAAAHFTSEMMVLKTVRFTGPQIFPFLAAYGGTAWMAAQYEHYVAG